MKALVIGAGKIGCGFAGQLLRESGYEVVFAARNRDLVEHLERTGRYQIQLVQDQTVDSRIVDGVRALSMDRQNAVIEEIAQTDLLVTAVGEAGMAQIAPHIASGLRKRVAPLNILAFENILDAGPRLRSFVADCLPSNFSLAKFGFSSVLVLRAVTQQLGDFASSAPLTFIGDPIDLFMVDASYLRPGLPAIKGMVVTNQYESWFRRKLYLFSAGHATTAYLGSLKGYHYIHTAIRDPEIRAAVLTAMAEGQAGLTRLYGKEIAGDCKDLLNIVKRFENAALNDPIVRVGRDPRRKIGAGDRLVGAASLALKAGIKPEKLILAAAAALCFYNPLDPLATEFQREIRSVGIDTILRRISRLDSAHGLGKSIADVWARLSTGGQTGSFLLSLDREMWAWSG